MSALTQAERHWNASLYGAMEAVFGLQLALESGAVLVDLWIRLWRMARRLRQLVAVYRALDLPCASCTRPGGCEFLEKSVGLLRELCSGTDEVLVLAHQHRLLQNPFFRGQVRSIETSAKELLDVAEAWELSLDPATQSNIDEALGELDRGETIRFDSLLNS